MKFGEWEPVLRDDPRGQPVPYYRGLVCLVAHGENIISVVTKDGSSIPSECWDDVAKLVASAPTLTTENARLTEELSDEKAKHAYALGTLETEIAERVRLTERVKVLEAALGNLVNAKALKGVREVVAGWNGEGKEDGPYERHHSQLGATLPKTNCGAIYELDEDLQIARTTLTHGEGK